jgi:predicted dehydrogenase
MIPSPFRWGILGPGKIARKFAASLPFSRNGKLTAVASRTEGKAEAFAADFGNVAAFQNYTDLLESGLVDAVYVAGTHNLHLEQATICLERGIPVLCEKPLTERLSDTQSLYALASARQTFLMEGMWSIFLPHIQKAFDWIQENRIGQLVHIQADFAYRADRNPDNRLFNPALGGSVSKDIGIYPLFLFHTLGKGIQELQHSGRKAETGIDEHVVFQGLTAAGASFQGMISFCGKSAAKASIIGTDGRIEIDSQWFRPVSARLQNEEGIEFFHPAVPGFGFQYEANEVEACVRNGKLHSAIWTPEDSIAMAKWMDVLQS